MRALVDSVDRELNLNKLWEKDWQDCCGWSDEKCWLCCAQAGRLLDSQSPLISSLACQTQLLNCICYGGRLLDLGSCVSKLSFCPSACSCSPAATLWASDQEFCSEEPLQWGRVSQRLLTQALRKSMPVFRFCCLSFSSFCL